MSWAIRHIHATHSGVHTVAVSAYLWAAGAQALNRAFLVLCMGAGLDAVIADPLDGALMAHLRERALLDRDEYCANYLSLASEAFVTRDTGGTR